MGKIGSSDQIPVYLNTPADTNVNAVGYTIVHVNICGYKKNEKIIRGNDVHVKLTVSQNASAVYYI